jgi:GH35 family endo-1,4-beta-xylanase
MKIKYIYNVQNLLEIYPTEEDILYEIIKYLKEKGKPIEEEWSDIGIKVAFSKKIEQEELDKILISLSAKGFLRRKEGSGKRSYYSVIKNPFS